MPRVLRPAGLRRLIVFSRAVWLVNQVQAALTAVEFGRGDMKEAERAWRGINVVDQQMYLKDAYLKDQLKWPPRVSSSLKEDQEVKDGNLPTLDVSFFNICAASTIGSCDHDANHPCYTLRGLVLEDCFMQVGHFSRGQITVASHVSVFVCSLRNAICIVSSLDS